MPKIGFTIYNQAIKRVKTFSLLVLTSVLLVSCSSLEGTQTSEIIQINIAYPSTADIGDIPSILVLEMLAEQGYEIERTFYAQTDLAVEALSSGDADFAYGSTRTYWAAKSKGANFVMIMEQVANDRAILAVSDIQTCEDLDGRRFAVGGEGSGSHAMSVAYILENCPGTEVELFIIPGSENRAAALLAGEIDATPVELADAIQLDLKAPDRIHVLTNFALDLPNLNTTGVYVNSDFAANNPQVVKDFIEATLDVRRRIRQDQELLTAVAVDLLKIDQEILPLILDTYLGIDAWDVNGGISFESIQFSIDFWTNADRLDPGLTPEFVVDFSLLDEILAEIGKE